MTKVITRFLERLVNNTYLSYWLILICDTALSTFGTLCTILFFNRFIHPVSFDLGFNLLLFSAFTSVFVFYSMRTHRSIIRYSSFKSIGKIMLAVLLKVILVALPFAVFAFWAIPIHLLICAVIDGIFTFALLILARLALIIIYDLVLLQIGTHKSRVLIYGTDAQSLSLKVALHTSKHYQAVGFIIHGPRLKSYRMADLPIFYFDKEATFPRLVDKNRIDGILFSDDNQAKKESDRLIRYCEKASVKSLIAPSIDFEKGVLKKTVVRDIAIEDLLGRDEIQINLNKIIANFNDKVILVTGAAGSIGSELCRQLASFGVKQLILFDNAETPMHEIRLELETKYPQLKFTPFIGDMRATHRLCNVFEQFHPQVVFHAAAYKHVPLMEENPCEAVRVNVAGTRMLADFCVEYDVEKMVMVSTDKAVNPTNVMGASKRMAEMYVQSLGLAIEQGKVLGKTKFVTTRFGNVLGSNGSVIPYFRKQIKAGGPVTVTHPEINRFFMTIPEACRLVMEAATMSEGNDIFVFDMGEPVKIVDLADRMIRLAGYVPNEDIKIEFTGLRPGEKLYEEVLSSVENTSATAHHKIRRADIRPCDLEQLRPKFDEIAKLAYYVDVDATVHMMKEVVPEFISKNSIFEEMDKK